jgi:prophage regulatory protein
MRMLSIKDVAAKTGLHKATIYRLERAGQFPARVKLTAARSGWSEASVDGWLESRGVKPDQLPAKAMPWYASAFLGATRGWPLVARAVYRELLEAQWDLGSLPDNQDELRRIVGCSPEEWATGWQYCKRKFKPGRDGCLRNPRLEAIRASLQTVG